MSEGLEFGKSVRSTILDEKDNENFNQAHKSCLKKKTLIIMILSICVVILIISIVLYVVLRDKASSNDNQMVEPNQNFSVTIEVFNYQKGNGEKEQQKKNLGITV